MSATTIPINQPTTAARVILWSGLIAGVLDLAGACLVAWIRGGVTPIRVFHSISSGIYGAAAFTGGVKMAALGIVLHFIIATTWAAAYYLASRRIEFLISKPMVAGVLYGVVVYLFMNFIILPLSAVARRPVSLSSRAIGLLVIILCIGLPIAFIVRRFTDSNQ